MNSLFHLFRNVYVSSSAIFQAEVDLSVPQFVVLSLVDEYPDINQTELVNLSKIDRSTLADVITRLSGRGWIERCKSKGDGRTNELRITKSGLNRLKEANLAATAIERKLIELTEDKLIQALPALQLVASCNAPLIREAA
jgi:DNA-binding MarR family transcriptional regulator